MSPPRTPGALWKVRFQRPARIFYVRAENQDEAIDTAHAIEAVLEQRPLRKDADWWEAALAPVGNL